MSRPVGFIHDPDAEKRSPMLQRKVLCNGERTGIRCDNYWTVVRNEPSQNPDFLVMGGKLRFCRAWGAEPLEFGEGHTELATSAADEPLHRGCTMYRPAGLNSVDEIPGLVQIARIPRPGKLAPGAPTGAVVWETKESFVYADAVPERNRFDAVYEDPDIYVDANVEALAKANERVPLRVDLTDGSIQREHEEAFSMTPGQHNGAPFIAKPDGKVTIDDAFPDDDDEDDAPAPIVTRVHLGPVSKPKKTVAKKPAAKPAAKKKR